MNIEIDKWIARKIWMFCETRNISLGRFGPHIVSVMLGGVRYYKLKKEAEDESN